MSRQSSTNGLVIRCQHGDITLEPAVDDLVGPEIAVLDVHRTALWEAMWMAWRPARTVSQRSTPDPHRKRGAKLTNRTGARQHHEGVSASPPPDFAVFYEALQPRMTRVAIVVTGDRGRAEDAVQVGFARAFGAWGRVKKADDPAAYVRRIIINAALSEARKASRRHEVSTESVDTHASAAGSTHDPDTRTDLLVEIAKLPPRQRAVVVLRFYEDLSEAQIAEALGCRPGTVKSQASAAMKTLRTRMGDTYQLRGTR